MTITQDSRRSMHSAVPSVYNVVPPTSVPLTIAVLGMLGLQFCFMMLLGWSLLVPADDLPRGRADVAAIKTSLDQLTQARQREADIDAKLQVLEMVVRQGSDAPAGVLKSLTQERALNEELRASLRGQQSLARELESKANELAGSLADANRQHQRNQSEIAELESKVATLRNQIEKSSTKSSSPDGSPEAAAEANEKSLWASARANSKPIGIGALLGALTIGAVMAVAQQLKKPIAEQPVMNGIVDE